MSTRQSGDYRPVEGFRADEFPKHFTTGTPFGFASGQAEEHRVNLPTILVNDRAAGPMPVGDFY